MATGLGHDEQLQGAIGERELTRLAQEARLDAMKAVPDLGGWDFCVQESESPSDAPLDCRPPPRRWMVQVKTVRSLESVVSITLSNWRRMAAEPVPWFVLVVEVVDLQPKRSFLVHIGKHWIAKVLERLFKLRPGTEGRLNKLTMGLSFRNAELLPATGEGFGAALRSQAGDEPATYAANKQHLVQTVGYNDTRFRGTLQLGVDGFDHLSEFAVGIRDHLPVRNVAVDRVRFGAAKREAEGLEGALALRSIPVSGRARITLERPGGGERCSLEFDVVQASKVLPGLPAEHERVVLKHPIVQLHLNSRNDELDLHFAPPASPEAVPLATVGLGAEFMARLADASQTRGVQGELQVNDGPVLPLILEIAVAKKQELAEVALPLANAWFLARRAGLEHLNVYPWEVYGQQERLAVARGVLAGSVDGAARLREVEADTFNAGLSAVAGATAVQLGGLVCAFGISCTGPGRKVVGADGKPEVWIDHGVYRAHGLHVLSREQFAAERATAQLRIDEAVAADLSALGVASVFFPIRDGRSDRLLLHFGYLPEPDRS